MEIQNCALRSRKKPSATCASLKVTVMEFAVMSVTVTSLGGTVGIQGRLPSTSAAEGEADKSMLVREREGEGEGGRKKREKESMKKGPPF